MWHSRLRGAIAVLLTCSAGGGFAAPKSSIPSGFVYLAAVDPTIRQDMRYATPNNFTGAVVDGYQAPECILTAATAKALAKAQRLLASRYPRHVLKVYDCYRPVRAVRLFSAWSREPGGAAKTGYYHPAIPRSRLFALGYIAAQSGHSRGNVVDLTIEPADAKPKAKPAPDTAGHACTAAQTEGNGDGSLDMGTAFDCFDRKSHTWSGGLKPDQSKARAMLLEVMQACEFENFSKEWWHFSYPDGGARDAQDFPITARQESVSPAGEPPAASDKELQELNRP